VDPDESPTEASAGSTATPLPDLPADPEPVVVEAEPTDDQAIERAKPRPVSGGHVKVIGPVSRPDRDSPR
jgi:hypothetical protein